MFLKCKRCGAPAHPALTYMHHLAETYCMDCTRQILTKREQLRQIDAPTGKDRH